ncbi:MAG: hypothetical protein E7091_04130 [Bacteroidales bacterium]|nr:hypothetical protein [Bacteroidales bacterium]
MSTLLYILVVVGAIYFKYVKEWKSDGADIPSTGEDILTETFPTYQSDEETSIDDEPECQTSLSDGYRYSHSDIVEPRTKEQTILHEVLPDNEDLTEVHDEGSSKERIILSTREEARRAFIYSEIFNRKYE